VWAVPDESSVLQDLLDFFKTPAGGNDFFKKESVYGEQKAGKGNDCVERYIMVEGKVNRMHAFCLPFCTSPCQSKIFKRINFI
jgi:hypothetical protein